MRKKKNVYMEINKESTCTKVTYPKYLVQRKVPVPRRKEFEFSITDSEYVAGRGQIERPMCADSRRSMEWQGPWAVEHVGGRRTASMDKVKSGFQRNA